MKEWRNGRRTGRRDGKAKNVNRMFRYSTLSQARLVKSLYNTNTGSSPVSFTTTRYGNPTNTTSGPCSFLT